MTKKVNPETWTPAQSVSHSKNRGFPAAEFGERTLSERIPVEIHTNQLSPATKRHEARWDPRVMSQANSVARLLPRATSQSISMVGRIRRQAPQRGSICVVCGIQNTKGVDPETRMCFNERACADRSEEWDE